MSTVTQTIDQSNFKAFEYDTSKIFIWNNRTDQATFKNNTGGAAAFSAGTLLARDSSDNTIVPLLSTNITLGLNIPLGILMQDIAEIADAATVTGKSFCIAGEFAAEKLIFQGADNYNTVIQQNNIRTIRDGLLAVGLIPRVGDELTLSDNS